MALAITLIVLYWRKDAVACGAGICHDSSLLLCNSNEVVS
jgi:hypothetical protein